MTSCVRCRCCTAAMAACCARPCPAGGCALRAHSTAGTVSSSEMLPVVAECSRCGSSRHDVAHLRPASNLRRLGHPAGAVAAVRRSRSCRPSAYGPTSVGPP
eukprot:Mrub_01570.p6 GENE.Mrub_01570~~Mrub_01570.p6  ORF type:complete len:102 (-),score=31.72 Mrub_01570:262-567(-)